MIKLDLLMNKNNNLRNKVIIHKIKTINKNIIINKNNKEIIIVNTEIIVTEVKIHNLVMNISSMLKKNMKNNKKMHIKNNKKDIKISMNSDKNGKTKIQTNTKQKQNIDSNRNKIHLQMENIKVTQIKKILIVIQKKLKR